MGRGAELMGEVRDQVIPASLVYFASVKELANWVAGDQEKRAALEKRWRRKYDDHRKATGARQKADRVQADGR